MGVDPTRWQRNEQMPPRSCEFEFKLMPAVGKKDVARTQQAVSPATADSSFAGEVDAGCVDVIACGCDVPAPVRRTHAPARDLGDAEPADELRFNRP